MASLQLDGVVAIIVTWGTGVAGKATSKLKCLIFY